MPFTNLAPLTPPLRYTTSRFVIMETTNGVYNRSLYEAITPNSALMWQRAQVRGGGGRVQQELVRGHHAQQCADVAEGSGGWGG